MIKFISSILKSIWRHLTPSNALASAKGDVELKFLESIYRITYFLGLSFVDNNSIPYLIYSKMVKVLVAAFGAAEAWFVISEFDNLELDSVAASINTIAIHSIAVFKMKNMMDHRDVYRSLADSLESLDRSTDSRKRLVEYWANTQVSYLKLLLALGHCTLLAWHLYPLIDDVEYNLMVAVYIPFRYDTLIRYSLTYIVVGVAFLYISHWVMISDLTLQAYLISLVCQLTVLSDCFTNIVKDCSDGIEGNSLELKKNNTFCERYQKRMAYLIKQHNLILKPSAWNNTIFVTLECCYLCWFSQIVFCIKVFIMDLRSLLSYPLLCQLGASGVLICFIGYQALSTTIAGNIIKFLMSLFYLGYNMFELFIICRWCEEITIQSQNIGAAAYCSGWEMGLCSVPGTRTSIMMIIARANKPLVFSAGGAYNMSLKAFTNLVKTSYSALTVLLRFQQE